MELSTRDSGSMESEMAMEHRCGLMEVGMRVIGVMIKLMDKES